MLIVEIKARCAEHDRIRRLLRHENARFVGEDHQIDTYYHVSRGRMKWREGNIENALICYDRTDQPTPKPSRVLLYHPQPGSALQAMLAQALGVRVVVDKRREIFFIDNVKFHLDMVADLGRFVEIEAIDAEGTLGKARLQEQCEHYLDLFNLPSEALVSVSYSDLLLQAKAGDA